MFGRTKKQAIEDDAEVESTEVDEAIEDEDDEDAVDEAVEATDEATPGEPAAEEFDDDADEVDAEPLDPWVALDRSQDWRYDGPFDIDEVDLDADDVQRLDFGTLIITPFDGMKLQLQVNPANNQVQAVLVMHGQSALEVAVFAAPARSSMLAEVRADMAEATEKAGGEMSLAEGPFGTEVRRTLPVTTPDGKQGQAITRTWFAEGPKWLLRGVLMGQAALKDGQTGAGALLYEFFCNAVVRRGDEPHVPGQLIPMTVPSSLLAGQGPDGATS